jgi:tetratricopeptide (TPR) repeat protein
MERPEEAIQTANEVLRMSPGVLKALYVRGVASKIKGDIPGALRDLEQVRSGDSRTEQTLLLLGQMYMQQGQPEKGRALVAEYHRNQAVGDTLVRLGLHVSAQPNDWRGHFDLGEYYLRGGSLKRAIVELKRAIELNPGQKESRAQLVRAFKAAHRDEEAEALSGVPGR